MDIYINKIRDILIDCMPIHWYKCYLFFECTESGMSSDKLETGIDLKATKGMFWQIKVSGKFIDLGL